MSENGPPEGRFFLAGGTVPPGTPSYIERRADGELFDTLLAGQYCYVLNSRQMGKSSLAVRTIAKLGSEGVCTAFVDLTRVGGANVTSEQWYAGLLIELGRALGLRTNALKFYQSHPQLGPSQRFFAWIQEVAISTIESPLVIFLDEIDATRSLPFTTDDLFAGIRQFHNGRANEASLNRLTFCLLGAALPSNLIKDPRSTPFNVGRRIELRDFSEQEAGSLANGIDVNGRAKLRRILYWTGGHPFLTQAICAEVQENPGETVDRIVEKRYLSELAQESDTNLADVANRLLGRGDPEVNDKDVADVLSTFRELLKRGVSDDEANSSIARIKMSGVARLSEGRLMIRNRIYKNAFDDLWVRRNVPGQEVRRQRRAFWRGAIRALATSSAVIGIVSFLAFRNLQLARNEAAARRSAEYELYAARMNLIGDSWSRHDIDNVYALLDETRRSVYRGLEWSLWKSVAGSSLRFTTDPHNWCNFPSFSPDTNLIVIPQLNGFVVRSSENGKIISFVHSSKLPKCLWTDNRHLLVQEVGKLSWIDAWTGSSLWVHRVAFTDYLPRYLYPVKGEFFLSGESDGKLVLQGYDIQTGKKIGKPSPGFLLDSALQPVGTQILVSRPAKDKFLMELLNPSNLVAARLPLMTSQAFRVSKDLKKIAFANSDHQFEIRTFPEFKFISSFGKVEAGLNEISISEDDRYLGAAYRNLHANVFDLSTGQTVGEYSGTNSIGVAGVHKEVLTAYRAVRVYDLLRKSPDQIKAPAGLWKGIQPRKDETFAVGWPNSIGMVNFSTGKFARYEGAGLSALAWNCPYRGRLAFTLSPKICSLVDPESGLENRLTTPFPIYSGTLSADNRFAAVFNEKLTSVSLIQLKSLKVRWTDKFPTLPTCFEFDPSGSTLAIGEKSGEVVLLDTTSGLMKYRSLPHDYFVWRVIFSRDGKQLISCGDDDKASILNVETHQSVPLIGHSFSVEAGDIASSGDRAVTASDDGSVIVWDTETGRALTRIPIAGGVPVDVRFSEDGKRLAVLTSKDIFCWNCADDS